MRLLFLHGFQQSPTIVQEESGFLQSYLEQVIKGFVEIAYPTAPFLSEPRPSGQPTYSWWPEHGEDNLQETFIYLNQILEEEGPFDAIAGFSQGASLACLVAAILEQPQANRPEGLKVSQKTCKFGLSFSGYREDDPRLQQYYPPQIATPILHVINTTDPIVSEERSMRLVRTCVDADERVVKFRSDGHRVPATKVVKTALARFILDTSLF